ncbi:MAG: DHA2 family efflux MFS transporter permease subunit, partial [Nitrospinae bacterium]|nr:DHA2 family efflux MFS transporter permease subunit [Nitrospinota bacterium]
MTATQASSSPQSPPPGNKWLVALAVMSATILEVLDMTVANVALDHIRGSLSAGVDEAAWVLTSYIVGNAIVIPLTGWLGRFFGRKRLFMFCIILFTTSSFLCGSAPNLQSLVCFRVVQGLGGGAMMPLSQAILMETFPPHEQGMAMAVWAIGMMVAPISGPILGGWITDNYSWRWVFYINVPVGAIAVLLIALILVDPPYIKRAVTRIDWWGLFFLVLGVGCLQILLDKGERADWFSSGVITTLAILSAVGLLLFVLQELRTTEPVVDLRILKNRTFAMGMVFATIAIFGLYGTFVLIPLYCQLVAGYTPLLAG